MVKNFIFLFVIFISASLAIQAQATVSADSNSTAIVVTNGTAKVPQPSKKKSKDTRTLLQRFSFNMISSFWVNPKTVMFEISPTLQYNFPKIYSIGAGPTYIYNRNLLYGSNLNGLGGKIFVRVQPLKFIYLWTEYQGIKNQYYQTSPIPNSPEVKTSSYVDSWMVGAGLNLHITKRFAINLSVLYDFLYNSESSPYYSDIIYRIGFNF